MQSTTRQLGILVVFGLLALVAGKVSAASIQFDENGNGGLPWTMATEPASGMTTLVYTLPFRVVPGDLVITDTNTTIPTSDIIRFDNNSSTGLAYFFSDPPEPNELPVPLADKGLPTLSASNSIVYLSEVGPEGNDGVTYAPAAGGPGSDLGGTTVTYTIVSDGTAAPEPSTFVLLGVAAISLPGYRWWRRKA
jgi:hypothetical protein